MRAISDIAQPVDLLPGDLKSHGQEQAHGSRGHSAECRAHRRVVPVLPVEDAEDHDHDGSGQHHAQEGGQGARGPGGAGPPR